MARRYFNWSMVHRKLIIEQLPYKTMNEIAEMIGVGYVQLQSRMTEWGISQKDYGGRLKIKPCRYCEKDFKPIKNNTQIFCSRRCKAKEQNRRLYPKTPTQG